MNRVSDERLVRVHALRAELSETLVASLALLLSGP